MKIDIHISDASPEQLAAIAQALSPLQKSNVAVQKSNEPLQKSKERRGWSKKAIRLANTKTPEAPYGLKMDGTPRKPTGLQKKEKK